MTVSDDGLDIATGLDLAIEARLAWNLVCKLKKLLTQSLVGPNAGDRRGGLRLSG